MGHTKDMALDTAGDCQTPPSVGQCHHCLFPPVQGCLVAGMYTAGCARRDVPTSGGAEKTCAGSGGEGRGGLEKGLKYLNCPNAHLAPEAQEETFCQWRPQAKFDVCGGPTNTALA